MVFSNGSTPEQLTALQLAQVMAASEVEQSHAFALLQEAKGFLQETGSTVVGTWKPVALKIHGDIYYHMTHCKYRMGIKTGCLTLKVGDLL